jgi:thioredoxin 1
MIKVIKFGADWCGPCKMLEPTIVSLKEKFNVEDSGVEVIGIDVDVDPETSSKYGIRNVPTIIFEKDGIVVERMVGVKQPSDIENKIKSLL